VVRRQKLLAAACALCLCAGAPAAAEVLLQPDAEAIATLSRLARENLTRARLLDGSNVPPETAAERSRPIIPSELTEQTVRRGYLSGEMEACGLDATEESYLPYMSAIRRSRRYSDTQHAYLGLLHGFSQATAVGLLGAAVDACSEEVRNRLRRAASRPVATP
jgi:hypothetical protein